MLRTALLLPIVYVTGGVGLSALAFWRLTSGDSEVDIALWIVLPIAWWVSFLPTAASLLAVFRVRRAFRMLERLHEQIQAQSLTEDSFEEQVEYWTDLAARENGVPRFMVRSFVRRLLERLLVEGSGRRAPTEVSVESSDVVHS